MIENKYFTPYIPRLLFILFLLQSCSAGNKLPVPLQIDAQISNFFLSNELAYAKMSDAELYKEINPNINPQVIEELIRRANQGNEFAQCELGHIYFFNQQDDFKARYWYEKAANQGNVLAQHALATMYISGVGGPQDLEKAKEWIKPFADKGIVAAEFRLAMIYHLESKKYDEETKEYQKQYYKALSLLKKSAEGGDERAKKALSLMVLNESLWGCLPKTNIQAEELGAPVVLQEAMQPCTYNTALPLYPQMGIQFPQQHFYPQPPVIATQHIQPIPFQQPQMGTLFPQQHFYSQPPVMATQHIQPIPFQQPQMKAQFTLQHLNRQAVVDVKKEKKVFKRKPTITKPKKELKKIKYEQPVPVQKVNFLDYLPKFILNDLLCYMGDQGMCSVRSINRHTYTYATGYERPGNKGVQNKPQPSALNYIRNWGINTRTIDFKEKEHLDLTSDNIPSVCFYELIGKVANIPEPYWDCMKDTLIHHISLTGTFLNDQLAAIELSKKIHSKIHTLDLHDTILYKSIWAEFAKNLINSHLHTLIISGSRLRNQEALELTQSLPPLLHSLHFNIPINSQEAISIAKNLPANIHTLVFQDVRFNTEKAEEEFADGLPSTLHTLKLHGAALIDEVVLPLVKKLPPTLGSLHLSFRALNPERLIVILKDLSSSSSIHTLKAEADFNLLNYTAEFAKNLPPTIHTLILKKFKFNTPQDAAEFAKNLPRSIHILKLTHNEIKGTQALELVKNLPPTVHILDLSYNLTLRTGLMAIAKELENTSLDTVYLHSKNPTYGYVPDEKIQKLLRKKCPKVRLIFSKESDF